MTKLITPSLLTWIRSFDSTARHQSFTLAAKELNVTQASISQQVKNLEDFLGCPLFTRTSRQLEFTSHGKKLFNASTKSFNILDQTIKGIKAELNNEATPVSCSPSFALTWLTPRISSLSQQKPQLKIKINGEFHLIDSQNLSTDDAIAAIRYDRDEYHSLKVTEFLDEWLIPVANADFINRHRNINFAKHIPSELMLHDAQPWDGAPKNAEWQMWLAGQGNKQTIEDTGMYFNLSILSIAAAIAGQGIAIGRMALVLEHLKQGILHPLVPFPVKSQASYKFITLKSQKKDINIIALSDWLRNEGDLFKKERSAYLKNFFFTQR